MGRLGIWGAGFALVLLLGASPLRAEDGFFPSLPDLPLLDGFAEDQTETLVFDKPAGRIAIAVAKGRGDAGRTRALYTETLIQIGWQPVKDGAAGSFVREGELLTLSVARDFEPGMIRVEISLAPLAQPAAGGPR